MLGRRKYQHLSGDWTNPSNDFERVTYRLEWYAFQFFAGRVPLEMFLKIVYQSWLQIMMIRERQTLDGPIYQYHGIFGTEFFVAFGGSEDSRMKVGNAFYSDRRLLGYVNTALTPPILGRAEAVAKEFFIYNRISISDFLGFAYQTEVALFDIEEGRKVSTFGTGSMSWEGIVKIIKGILVPVNLFIEAITDLSERQQVQAAIFAQYKVDMPSYLASLAAKRRQENLILAGVGIAIIAGGAVGYKYTKSVALLPLTVAALGGLGFYTVKRNKLLDADIGDVITPFEGQIIQCPSGPAAPFPIFFVYRVEGGFKRRFVSQEILNKVPHGAIVNVTMDQLTEIPVGKNIEL